MTETLSQKEIDNEDKNIGSKNKRSSFYYFYKVLGISSEVKCPNEIRKSYLKRIKKYHPDNCKDLNANLKFLLVQKAYKTIQRTQSEWKINNQPTTSKKTHLIELKNTEVKDNQLYKYYIPICMELNVSLEDVIFGAIKKITCSKPSLCINCSGSGTNLPERTFLACQKCFGRGFGIDPDKLLDSNFYQCQNCIGNGKIILDPCKICEGTGIVEKEYHLSVKIDAGMESGDYIFVGNEIGIEKPVIVKLKVENHQKFKQDGLNIHGNVFVPFYKSFFGGIVEVDTIYGSRKIRIKNFSKDGELYILPRHGIATREAIGEHIATLRHVFLPFKKKKNESKKLIIYQNNNPGNIPSNNQIKAINKYLKS